VVVPFRGKYRSLSAGKQAVNVAHAKIRAVGRTGHGNSQGAAARITDPVKAVLTLHPASA
jgi:hypothetical protein